jgi:hypothetical protein
MSIPRDSSHTLVLNSGVGCPAALDFRRGAHLLQEYEPGDGVLLTRVSGPTLSRGDLR